VQSVDKVNEKEKTVMEEAALKEAQVRACQEKSVTESQADKKAESESHTLLHAALERIDQMESDQAAARQLQREIEAEDAAQVFKKKITEKYTLRCMFSLFAACQGVELQRHPGCNCSGILAAYLHAL